MKNLEGLKNIKTDHQAEVYETENDSVIKIEKIKKSRVYNEVLKIYEKLIGMKLKNVVKILNIESGQGEIKIEMEKLIEPQFSDLQKRMVAKFADKIEFNQYDDFKSAFEAFTTELKEKARQFEKMPEMKFKQILDILESNKNNIKILGDLFNGFKELMSLKIYHDDMKPEHLMIDKDNNYKLIDFIRLK